MTKHDDRDNARFDEHSNTRPTGSNFISHDASDDGIDRRGFLRCMAWAGTGVVWSLAGGIPASIPLTRLPCSPTNSERASSSRRSATATSASTRRRTRT